MLVAQQTNLFSRQKRKLHPNQIKALDKAVRAIMSKPEIGKQKKGDLSSVRIHKFKIMQQEYLLAYQIKSKDRMILLALGSHENFYRDLKKVAKQ